VHGLAEVMERHVRSFEVMNDRSSLVRLSDAPNKIKLMAKQIESAGLTCHLRYSENSFGLAYFSAYVLEPDEHNPISAAAGFGFHPIAEIAAVRALAEAVQGRLSHIHGGRDDIIKRVMLGVEHGREVELDAIRRFREMASNPRGEMAFNKVPNFDVGSILDAQNCMFKGLARAGFNHVVHVTLTQEDYPFQVMKVVVPGAEMYEHDIRRVGPRLMAYFKHQQELQNA